MVPWRKRQRERHVLFGHGAESVRGHRQSPRYMDVPGEHYQHGQIHQGLDDGMLLGTPQSHPRRRRRARDAVGTDHTGVLLDPDRLLSDRSRRAGCLLAEKYTVTAGCDLIPDGHRQLDRSVQLAVAQFQVKPARTGTTPAPSR